MPSVPNRDPIPLEPKNIPTTKNSNNAGTPYLYPILSAKILTKNSRDNTNNTNSTCISILYSLFSILNSFSL